MIGQNEVLTEVNVKDYSEDWKDALIMSCLTVSE